MNYRPGSHGRLGVGIRGKKKKKMVTPVGSDGYVVVGAGYTIFHYNIIRSFTGSHTGCF